MTMAKRPVLRLGGTEFIADDAGNVQVTVIYRPHAFNFQRADLPEIIQFLQTLVKEKPMPPK